MSAMSADWGNFNMIKIIPAILPTSYRAIVLGADQVHEAVDTIQIDFVDGHFAHNRTWLYNNKETERYTAIEREEEGLPYWDSMNYEFDLMVKDPLEDMEKFIALGPSKMIFHIESLDEARMIPYLENIPHIMRDTMSFGIAIGIGTDPSLIAPYLEHIDTIQCMGIKDPGFQGRPFDEGVLEQIKKVKALYPDKSISVDGGVTLETAPLLIAAGADTLVVGSALFQSGDIYGTIEALQRL